MTRKPGPPSKGKRDRGRSGPNSPSRRSKPGFSGAGDRKPGAGKFGDDKFGGRKSGSGSSGSRTFGARTFGARTSDAKSDVRKSGDRPFGGSKFGGRKGAEAGAGRGPRLRDDRPGGRTPKGAARSGAPGRQPRDRAADSAHEGGDARRRRAFPDVPVRLPPRDDENRIAKVMARAGLCSRREAEDWIAAGRVAINGGTISSPAINVSDRDRVTVDGEPLPRRERTRLFLYHKPAGLMSTNSDPEGRPTLFDALPKGLPRLMSVGRLDINTEGLLLLTNDGGLARELELPETGWVRRYRVRAHGHVGQEDLDRLREGITVDGVHYGPIEATLERDQGANVWISFAIAEGKNREVRNVLGHLGLAVNRLIRVEFGPFGLGVLPEGAIEEVETGNLRAQLGPRIVARAGCDFSGPAAAVVQNREQRREQRHALHERLYDARRGPRDAGGEAAERRTFRRSRDEQDGWDEKPAGRPRRGHAWRQDDAPLGRTYRGSRREDLKIDEDRPDKRTSLTTDRKGREVVVERFGEPKEKPEPPARVRAPRRGPPRDRASGPRPSRPPRERGDRAGSGRPRKIGERSEGRGGASGPRKFGSRPSRPRFDDARDGEGAGRPRKFGARSEGRRDGKPGQKRGPGGPRPRGEGGGGPRRGSHPSGRPPRKR